MTNSRYGPPKGSGAGQRGRKARRRQSLWAADDAQSREIWPLAATNDQWLATRSDSALCTKCLVVALAGCSLSVTANVRTKGRRPLVLACDIVTKLSASHRGVRMSEGVGLWPLRAMSLAVEASAADVPDNRPLSDGRAGPTAAVGIDGWYATAGTRARVLGRPGRRAQTRQVERQPDA